MQVKMLTTAMGPKVNLYSGCKYEVDDKFGKKLVAGRYAVEVGEPCSAQSTDIKPTTE